MTAKDVRRLRMCTRCGTLGFIKVEPMDPLEAIVPLRSELRHLRCMPRPDIFSLPSEELLRVRLNDTEDKHLMHAILEELSRRRDF